MSGLSLVSLCCLNTVSSSLLTVLETTSDLAMFDPHTGAQLENSSTFAHKKVTVCARFLTHQFTTHTYEEPNQVVIAWGFEGVFSWWDGFDLKSAAKFGDWFRFPIWDMEVWNHVCIILDAGRGNLRIIMNGEPVLDIDCKADLSILDGNLSMMGKLTASGYVYSLFGRMTDVNMWGRSLTEEEAVSWTLCRTSEGGDLVDWRTATWEARGLQEVQVEREEVCRERQDRLMVTPFKRDFDDIVALARMLGGRMAVVNSQEATVEISKVLEPVKEICDTVFTGFTDRSEESVWVNVYTKEELTWQNWDVGQPNSNGNQDCAEMNVLTHWQHAYYCSQKLCAVIKIKESPRFQMRGVCKDSDVDIFYNLLVQTGNDTIMKAELLGLKQTKMAWSREQKRWNIVNLVNRKLLAYTNSTRDFPFGLHRWFFIDTPCSDPDQPWRELNLQQAVKQPGRFCCEDGLCIDSEFKCDGNNHCLDSSDEKICQTVQVPQTYNIEIPPLRREISEDKFYPLHIATHVKIKNILSINNQESTILLKFVVTLKWFDDRLSYNFLKADANKNSVSSGIWTPEFTFVDRMDQTKAVEVHRHTTIEKLGKAVMDGGIGERNLYENESYTGSDNPITLKIRYKGEFFCDFSKIVNYPFDTEECFVGLYLSGTIRNFTKLIPTQPVVDYGPSSVADYSVNGWKIESGMLEEGIKGVKVKVELGRRIGSIFLVTYLPTIVMNLINQATNYCKNNYDLLMTVNITCMVVLVSIYISVSNNLPVTAGLKYVEIWLLFNLVYPAMVIIVNIFIQVSQHINIVLKELIFNFFSFSMPRTGRHQ